MAGGRRANVPMTCPAGGHLVKLTTTAAKALVLPPGTKDKTFWDDELGGFGLRLRAGGARTWVVQYDLAGKSRRVTLGSTRYSTSAPLAPGPRISLHRYASEVIRLPISTCAELRRPRPSGHLCPATSLPIKARGGRKASSRWSADCRSSPVHSTRCR